MLAVTRRSNDHFPTDCTLVAIALTAKLTCLDGSRTPVALLYDRVGGKGAARYKLNQLVIDFGTTGNTLRFICLNKMQASMIINDHYRMCVNQAGP